MSSIASGRSSPLPHERNARNLYTEVLWVSLLSAAAAFNAPFAIRLGATNAEIGLLSSIPALLALLVTIPAGQILNRRARRMPLLIRSLFVHRLGFLLIVLIPWLPVAQKGMVVVWLLIAFSIPAHFFGVGWNSMLGDLIPETNRAQVFAIRNILAAAAVTSGTFLAGWWLERSVFPLNYQVMYVIGFAASLISIYYILKLQVPDSVVPPASPRQPVSFRSLWSGFQQTATHQPDFVRLVVNTLAHSVGLWMIGPLYVLYFMRVLGATEGWLGLNGMLGSLTAAIGYYLWQRVIVRWGENRVLKWTISVIGLYPVLVGLSPSLTLILVWTALNNLIAPGVSLSHFNMFLKICPEAERPVYIGIYTTIMNAGAFVMPLLGIYLANRFGLAPMLVAGGVLCLAGSSLFRIRPWQTPDSLAARSGL
ncbi:MAG: hypothetical protein AUK03_06260 [Anaerolineae bacterium CG2_30_64_16]|nr:MAG: hypothetical protein AUK03_06260 [Anaerolineae bacterium CG2_30_64_16]